MAGSWELSSRPLTRVSRISSWPLSMAWISNSMMTGIQAEAFQAVRSCRCLRPSLRSRIALLPLHSVELKQVTEPLQIQREEKQILSLSWRTGRKFMVIFNPPQWLVLDARLKRRWWWRPDYRRLRSLPAISNRFLKHGSEMCILLYDLLSYNWCWCRG